MATTVPDSLTTPEPGDNYDVIAALSSLADDVQIALNKRDSGVLRGTAAQRAAAQATTAVGVLWVDTDSINMIWRRAASAFVPAVWHWSGTNAQMTAFAAPAGFEWRNTTDGLTYLRVGSTWTLASVTQSGIITGVAIAPATAVQRTVTFPKPYASAPNVIVSGFDSARDINLSVKSRTATQAVIEFGSTAIGTRTVGAMWLAVVA